LGCVLCGCCLGCLCVRGDVGVLFFCVVCVCLYGVCVWCVCVCVWGVCVCVWCVYTHTHISDCIETI